MILTLGSTVIIAYINKQWKIVMLLCEVINLKIKF